MFPAIRNQAKLVSVALAAVLGLVAFGSGDALAAPGQGCHFRSATFTVSDCTLVVACQVRGLGTLTAGEGVDVSLTGVVDANIQCENPGGQIVEAQAEDLPVNATGEFDVDQSGQVNCAFNISPTAQQLSGACPNPGWTPTCQTLTVESLVLSVPGADGCERVLVR